MWPSDIIRNIDNIAEASEVTQPWRILNIWRSSSKGLSSGGGGGGGIQVFARTSAGQSSAVRTSSTRTLSRGIHQCASLRVADAGPGQVFSPKWPSVGLRLETATTPHFAKIRQM